MSEFVEAVRASLTEEWQSTRRIADSVPQRGVTSNTHLSSIGRVLRLMERDGLVEGRLVPTVHGRDKEWRLKG